MDVDEVAHTSGVIFCRSPLSAFDPAPGTMHVEENEEIDRAIATILVIVTFELTRPGRDGLTDLADELHRTFVEAHDGPLCCCFGTLASIGIRTIDLVRRIVVEAPGMAGNSRSINS